MYSELFRARVPIARRELKLCFRFFFFLGVDYELNIILTIRGYGR